VLIDNMYVDYGNFETAIENKIGGRKKLTQEQIFQKVHGLYTVVILWAEKCS